MIVTQILLRAKGVLFDLISKINWKSLLVFTSAAVLVFGVFEVKSCHEEELKAAKRQAVQELIDRQDIAIREAREIAEAENEKRLQNLRNSIASEREKALALEKRLRYQINLNQELQSRPQELIKNIQLESDRLLKELEDITK